MHLSLWGRGGRRSALSLSHRRSGTDVSVSSLTMSLKHLDSAADSGPSKIGGQFRTDLPTGIQNGPVYPWHNA